MPGPLLASLVLLAAIASQHVLAHELGHFFGLPHSAAPGSLMNKSGDATPSQERRLVAAEQRKVTASARRFAKARAPVDRRTSARTKSH